MVFLLAQLVYSYAHHETTGAFVLWLTGVYAIPATLVLLPQWRAVRRARPDDTDGYPRASAPLAAHPAFGDAPGPTRW